MTSTMTYQDRARECAWEAMSGEYDLYEIDAHHPQDRPPYISCMFYDSRKHERQIPLIQHYTSDQQLMGMLDTLADALIETRYIKPSDKLYFIETYKNLCQQKALCAFERKEGNEVKPHEELLLHKKLWDHSFLSKIDARSMEDGGFQAVCGEIFKAEEEGRPTVYKLIHHNAKACLMLKNAEGDIIRGIDITAADKGSLNTLLSRVKRCLNDLEIAPEKDPRRFIAGRKDHHGKAMPPEKAVYSNPLREPKGPIDLSHPDGRALLKNLTEPRANTIGRQ